MLPRYLIDQSCDSHCFKVRTSSKCQGCTIDENMVNRFLFLTAPGADRVVLLANAMPILLKEEGMATSQLLVDDTPFPRPGLLDCFGPQRHVYVSMALTCVGLNLMLCLIKDLKASLVVMSLA